jgi:hypothetical protein
MSGQTVWREGDRIRATDGTGYGDRVSDDEIRNHISMYDESTSADPEFVSFAEAVLAIRAFERACAASPPVVFPRASGGDGRG